MNTAARKAMLVQASTVTRRRIAQSLAPAVRLEASVNQVARDLAGWLRKPVVLGAIAAGAMLVGPGRLLRMARWGAVSLAFRPAGRALLPWMGRRLGTLFDRPSREPRPR